MTLGTPRTAWHCIAAQHDYTNTFGPATGSISGEVGVGYSLPDPGAVRGSPSLQIEGP